MNTQRQVQGAVNKRTGGGFEAIISQACNFYKLNGIAVIEKTPEPMRVVRKQTNTLFTCFFEKKAQADYKGTLREGKSIVFEAKHTTRDRLQCGVVKPQQRENLDAYAGLGAKAYVLIGFSFSRFFFVPWEVFKNVKRNLGRDYLKPDDLTEFEVKMKRGYLDFLKTIS